MKFIDKIKHISKVLVDFGVDSQLPYLELRKAKLMNLIVFSISGILAFFLVLNIVIENYFLAIADVLVFVLVCIPSWYLQYKRHYKANMVLITVAFLFYTVALTILSYDEFRQTEHILITVSLMPIFLFDKRWKNFIFLLFPISFFTIKFVVMYQKFGYIEIYTMHLIYAISFLIIYVFANYFKGNMMHFYSQIVISNQTKDKLFRIISHDIKNPFSSLLGSSDLQLKYIETQNLEKLAITSLIINTASKKIYDLTATLLEWSQAQTETFIVNKVDTDLTDLVGQVVDFCTISSSPKEIKLDFKPEKPIYVACDIIMTQIALRNILMNAIKFSHRNSQINIIISKNENFASIAVIDYGVGMTETNLQNVFTDSVIESNLGTEKERGTGLGLKICKELLDKQGATIVVKSEHGKGSEFTISLPLK